MMDININDSSLAGHRVLGCSHTATAEAIAFDADAVEDGALGVMR